MQPNMVKRLPRIPLCLLHPMEAVISHGSHDRLQGGQFVQEPPAREQFLGVVMPISNEDIRTSPPGTYTQDQRKIYTNDYRLTVGSQVTDLHDLKSYMVEQELDHQFIHTMRRYIVTRKGVASPR